MSDKDIQSERHEAEHAGGLSKAVSIDTVHNDEALKVLATYEGDQEWTEEEEKRLRRKIDRRLLSILCATYGLQYYDKAMLSQAVCTPPTPFSSTLRLWSGPLCIRLTCHRHFLVRAPYTGRSHTDY